MPKLLTYIILSLLSISVYSQSPQIFFSEYIEGDDNNKALEIFNPTNIPVELNNYRIALAKDGQNWSEYFSFSANAVIKPLSTYVILHSSADSKIISFDIADQLILAASSFKFNGNDALSLIKIELDDSLIIDIIGNPLVNPGLGWTVAGVSNATYNHGIVRNEKIYYGNTNWSESAGTNNEDSEWEVLSNNDFSNLGKHDFNPTIYITQLILSVQGNKIGIDEDGANLQCQSAISPINANNQELKWKSSNPSIASVNANGTVTAFNNGEVYIKASTTDGTEISDSILLIMSNQSERIPVNSIKILVSEVTDSIKINKASLQMLAEIQPENATTLDVVWTVNDISIAKIDGNGTLSALKNGSVIIKATALDGSGIIATKVISIIGQFNDISSIKEIREAGISEGTIYKLTKEIIISHSIFNENKKYIQDETGALEINDPDGKISSEYHTGDGMTNLMGYLEDYFGVLQIHPIEDPGVPSSTNNSLAPQEISIYNFNTNYDDYETELIQINNLKFLEAGGIFEPNTNYKLYKDQDSLVFRTQFVADYLETEIPDSLNITGIALEFNGTPKIAARSLNDIEILLKEPNLIKNSSIQSIFVYPNPATENIYLNNINFPCHYSVYSISGQTYINNKNLNQKKINIEGLPRGIYFLIVNEQNKKHRIKFVKQ